MIFLFSVSERLIVTAELERLAVDALRLCRVGLVSRDADLVKSAIVLVAAMVRALLHAAFYAMICMFLFHIETPPFLHILFADRNFLFAVEKIRAI